MFNLDFLRAKRSFYLGAFDYAILIVSSLRDLRECRHKKIQVILKMCVLSVSKEIDYRFI